MMSSDLPRIPAGGRNLGDVLVGVYFGKQDQPCRIAGLDRNILCVEQAGIGFARLDLPLAG